MIPFGLGLMTRNTIRSRSRLDGQTPTTPVNTFRLFPKYRFPMVVPVSRPCRANLDERLRANDGLISAGRAGLQPFDGETPDAEGRLNGLESMLRTSIVLADDHAVVRQTVKRILYQQADLFVAGESANGLETLSLVKRLQPDLLVTDLMMPGMNGLEVIRRVRLSYPATRIVVLSVSGDDPYVAAAFRCGANGFVFKPSCGRYLVPALRAAMSGQRFVSPPLAEPAV